MHDCFHNCDRTTPCSICCKRRQAWKDDIKTQGSKLCWRNADASRWETDYWEIAKVFMEPGKNDPSIAGPADTDAIGLLQLVINCDLFDGCIISRQRFKDVS